MPPNSEVVMRNHHIGPIIFEHDRRVKVLAMLTISICNDGKGPAAVYSPPKSLTVR
jgi:hypothetical protein